MRIIIFLEVFLSSAVVFGQKTGTVTYILPDKVEVLIDRYLQANMQNASDGHYAVIERNGSDTFKIIILKNDFVKTGAKSTRGQWIQETNRCVLIDKTRIPLLLDYDFEFALADENRIGKLGQRDGVVSHIYPLNHDYYSLKFLNSTGAVVEGSAK